MRGFVRNKPLFSVCVPAYNRSEFLSPLLDSIFQQDEENFELVICEDNSPERRKIALIIEEYESRYPGKLRYIENKNNLGYDGNIRELINQSKGDYCIFMGNDDLMCAGALKAVATAVNQTPDCGVVVRSYATFDESPEKIKQVFLYFPEKHVLPAGVQAISTAYRRSVVIPGMVIKRDAALAMSSDRFDGTLLYQLYLVGMLLAKHSVVFIPQIIALRRDGTPPDFGSSASEKGKFVPRDQTPDSSIHFMRGMLSIAQYIEEATQLKVFKAIRSDIGSYSYPILSIQANRQFCVFFKYGLAVAKLGLWRSPFFHVYFLTLLILGREKSDAIIKLIKRRLGYTPRFGAASMGKR